MDFKEMSAAEEPIEIPPINRRPKEADYTVNRIISFAKTLGLITVIYFFGYQRWSVAWLYCAAIIVAFNGRLSKERRQRWDVARAMAMGFEKELLSAKLHFLPSWVHFPDIERVEWLNRIIRQIWVRVNHYTRYLVPKIVEPIVQSHIKSFKFDEVILGHVPLRIDGIKVYDEDISRNKIVMDLDISYAGDCRITFQVAGMKGGIEDFQLRGRLRVVLKPLISTIPLIGGLQAYFMDEPDIDFELVGVAQLLAIPGLRNILQKSVLEAINSIFLFPSMYTQKLSKDVDMSALKIFEPEGIIRVHVVEAKHLMKKDISIIGKGKSDPYAVLIVGPKKVKTMTIDNTVDPKWDFWCEFEAESNWDLNVHVWDKDEGSKDESLGSCNVCIRHIVKKGADDLWVPLQGVMHGMIHLRVFWMSFSYDGSDLDAALEESKTLGSFVHSALLVVYVESAKNLQTKSFTLPDPYVVLQVDKNLEQSHIESQTCNPLWEQGFTFMVYNPRTAKLSLTVMDKKSGNEIGELSYKLSLLLERHDLEIKNQPFILTKAGPECTVRCSFKLRIFKRHAGDVAKEPIDPTTDVGEEPPSPLPPKPPMIKQESRSSIKSKNSIEDTVPLDPAPTDQEETTPTPRNSLSSIGDSDSGHISILLTLTYNIHRQRLVVIVHQVANIPAKNSSNLPDPYVKLYLLPHKSKDSKRKTRVLKDNCNPIFDETFEYTLTLVELNTMQLEVTVSTEKKTFNIGNNILGQIVIDLGKYNLMQTYNAWFDLKSRGDSD